MKFGLKTDVINSITIIFQHHVEVEKVILYGSRAKGNFKPSSDIDLTFVGELLNQTILNKISWELDDLLLPYTFDLSIYHHLDNSDLIDHIERIGIVFYTKELVSSKKS